MNTLKDYRIVTNQWGTYSIEYRDKGTKSWMKMYGGGDGWEMEEKVEKYKRIDEYNLYGPKVIRTILAKKEKSHASKNRKR